MRSPITNSERFGGASAGGYQSGPFGGFGQRGFDGPDLDDRVAEAAGQRGPEVDRGADDLVFHTCHGDHVREDRWAEAGGGARLPAVVRGHGLDVGGPVGGAHRHGRGGLVGPVEIVHRPLPKMPSGATVLRACR